MTDEQKAVAAANHWRTEWMAVRLERYRKIPPGDALAVAENAVIVAAREHDPARGAFSTLYFRAAQSEANRWHQYNRTLGYRTKEIGRGPTVQGGDSLLVGRSLATKPPLITPEEWLDLSAILEAIEALDPIRREVIKARILRGEQLRDIGDRLGLTKERIRQLCGEAIMMIRKRLKIEATAC